jgi:hypothetical protein
MATDPTTNYGNANVSWSYQELTRAQVFNQLLRNIIKPGIYSGGTFSKIDDSTIALAAYTAWLNVDSDKAISVATANSFNLTVTEATPVLYISFSWSDQVNNYPVYTWKAVGAGASTNQICVGRVNFSGGNVDGTFDYTNRTYGLIDTSGNIYCSGDIQGGVPVGAIIAWMPGYFADGSNGTYTGVSITLSSWWKECDGAALSLIESPYLGGTGHYLPNLTDDRFLMGDVSGSAGGIGGGEGHYHGMGTGADLNITASGNHNHSFISDGGSSPSILNIKVNAAGDITKTSTQQINSATHTHAAGDFSGNIGLVTGGVDGNVAEAIKPKYLSVRYIQRIK